MSLRGLDSTAGSRIAEQLLGPGEFVLRKRPALSHDSMIAPPDHPEAVILEQSQF